VTKVPVEISTDLLKKFPPPPHLPLAPPPDVEMKAWGGGGRRRSDEIRSIPTVVSHHVKNIEARKPPSN
jgi:hypothetical protein